MEKKNQGCCSDMKIADTSANPGPLGLIGFGMTTVLLNLHNAGFYGLTTEVLGMGLFVGGIAQIIAGILESKKNNTFGLTAFTAYGSFWLSLVAILLLPKMGLGTAPSTGALSAYLGIWGVFTFGMFIASLKLHRAIQVVFISLVVLYFMLAIGDYTHNATLKIWAGYEGIFCGLSAMYASLAQVINEVHKKQLLPL